MTTEPTRCPSCAETIQLPLVGTDFVCGCGIRYSATIDVTETHRLLMRTRSELRDLRARLRAVGTSLDGGES